MDYLVRRAKKHDKSAFTELMKDIGGDLYKIGKAILKDDEDIADAMQETALNCWEKINSLKKDRYFRTWITRIMINNCYEILRQKKKIAADPETLPAVSYENGYESVEWQTFLNCLDAKYRTVVILYYVQGFKSREIASILNLNESTVRGRLQEARHILEREYGCRRENQVQRASRKTVREIV